MFKLYGQSRAVSEEDLSNWRYKSVSHEAYSGNCKQLEIFVGHAILGAKQFYQFAVKKRNVLSALENVCSLMF